jgi:protein-disulfide isomerase
VTTSIDLAVAVGPIDHALGPQDASVTVVEYGDFECPICKQAAPAVKLLLERHASQIRFAYRHFPLERAHPHALPAAEAAESAARQGRFWEMHDLLFDNQQHLESKDLHEYARRLKLDNARFEAEMEQHVHVRRIREDLESGERSHVRGTPGFFVNGAIVDVTFGMRALFDATEAVLNAR